MSLSACGSEITLSSCCFSAFEHVALLKKYSLRVRVGNVFGGLVINLYGVPRMRPWIGGKDRGLLRTPAMEGCTNILIKFCRLTLSCWIWTLNPCFHQEIPPIHSDCWNHVSKKLGGYILEMTHTIDHFLMVTQIEGISVLPYSSATSPISSTLIGMHPPLPYSHSNSHQWRFEVK